MATGGSPLVGFGSVFLAAVRAKAESSRFLLANCEVAASTRSENGQKAEAVSGNRVRARKRTEVPNVANAKAAKARYASRSLKRVNGS